jgi:hypothetical protein
MRPKIMLGFLGVILAVAIYSYWLTLPAPLPLRDNLAAPLPPRGDRPRVLVFKERMGKGLVVMKDEIVVRAVKDDEMAKYVVDRHRYLPALPEVVFFRVLSRPVDADVPLMKDDFEPIGTLEPAPGMKAVRLRFPLDDLNGGIPKVGDRVNLCVSIDSPGRGGKAQIATSPPIAEGVKVLGRGDLWTTLSIELTLEMNPYRKALVEFAKQRGVLTISPAPKIAGAGSLDPDLAKKEERRVAEFLHGQLITDREFEEITGFPAVEPTRSPIFHLPDFEPRGLYVLGPPEG